ncbi:MAG: hypothetical protein IT442_04480 [Phycisphaeraceae bacterium]|nr:hypothetical protein [Phycisphaeraceae bacterium]
MTEFEMKLLRLLGLMLVQERQQAEQIRLLGRVGFKAPEIASMLETTSNTVSVTLSKQRRNNGENKTRRRKRK